MGYDMRMAEEPEVSDDDKAKAKEIRDKAWAMGESLRAAAAAQFRGEKVPGDHDEREREYWRLHREADRLGNPGHISLNVWGMERCSAAMQELGMEHWPSISGDSVMKWPKWDDSLSDDEAEEKWERETAPIRAYHSPDEPPTIPGHKFGSNDGWHVTPDEIRAALAAYADRTTELSQKARETIETDYWGRWIDYLTRAADHGGFYVH